MNSGGFVSTGDFLVSKEIQRKDLNAIKNLLQEKYTSFCYLLQEMYTSFNNIVNEGGIEPVDPEMGDSLDDLLHHSECMIKKCQAIAEVLGFNLED